MPSSAASSRGRAINIHHSFLPSFKGAKPYYQAHLTAGEEADRATAHYVTADLDEGPIIGTRCGTRDHPQPGRFHRGRARRGVLVLARAVKWHVEHQMC